MSNSEPTRIVFEYPDGRIVVSPQIFPGASAGDSATNLDGFARYGIPVYGAKPHPFHPFDYAPRHETSGGVLYTGSGAEVPEGLATVVGLMGFDSFYDNRYCVLTAASANPAVDKYLQQIRVVSNFGLRFAFEDTASKYEEPAPVQELTPAELLAAFIRGQQSYWTSTEGKAEFRRLVGDEVADSDWEWPRLGFGFLVESHYHSIFRAWSRIWYVTK